jgi:hypothetical protein
MLIDGSAIATDRMVAGGGDPGRCISAACAAAYRVPLLAA